MSHDLVVSDQQERVLLERFEAERSVLKATVAKGCNDAEFRAFILLAAKYRLDPFLKQIWCVKFSGDNGPATVYAGRDGLLANARRSSEYGGMQSQVVRAGDEFDYAFVNGEPTWTHKATARGGDIVGAWAVVYRKDPDAPNGRIANFRYCPMAEHNKGNSTWKTYGAEMILKCAEAHVLAKAFPIDGLQIGDAREWDLDGPTPKAVVVGSDDPFNDGATAAPVAEQPIINATFVPISDEQPAPAASAPLVEKMRAAGFLNADQEANMAEFKRVCALSDKPWRETLSALMDVNPGVGLEKLCEFV